jgi:hypothetical protein
MDDIPPKEIEAIRKLFLPIGHIVIQWSFVDTNLELCLNIIAEYYDDKNIINIKSRQQLTGRKITLFKKCLNELTSLISFKKEGLLIMQNAENIGKKRNIIIHGTYNGSNPDGSYNFHRLVFIKKKNQYSLEKHQYTLSELNHLGKTIRGLAEDIAHLGFRLHPNKDKP